jgi:hypothetical protein
MLLPGASPLGLYEAQPPSEAATSTAARQERKANKFMVCFSRRENGGRRLMETSVYGGRFSSTWPRGLSGNDDDSNASLRLLNATSDVCSLSLYTGDDKRVADIAIDKVSSFAALGEGSCTRWTAATWLEQPWRSHSATKTNGLGSAPKPSS